jgi:hypothetical protein
MADVKPELVELRVPLRADEIFVTRETYDLLADFIITALTNENGEMNLNDLIEKANKSNLGGCVRGSALWYLLKVKKDLEYKNIIKITVDRGKGQRLSLLEKQNFPFAMASAR